jgi:uncharacterized repeat protein (TIGR01451 family)
MSKTIIFIAAAALLLSLWSCETSVTYWVPVYKVQFTGNYEKTKFDPKIKAVINPAEGVVVAYYETENKKGLAYGNDYSIALSEKVVITDDKLDKVKSTAKPVTNLELYKSFYYDTFSETEADRKMYVYRDGTLMALDQSLVKNNHIVEYMILGKNVGTNPISEIILADSIPAGFTYVSSEYGGMDNEKNVFKHKVIVRNNKTTVILEGKFPVPLKPVETFAVSIKLKADLNAIEKDFAE